MGSGQISVIGGGIGGLTAAALLAKRGYEVSLWEQAYVMGGCASTFKRRGFTFDVGATQVAGLEPGGIHHRIFTELGIDLPPATLCDPACAVFLPQESQPIMVWNDRDRWATERQQQFPGSDKFWQILQTLFQVSWEFQQRDPILPPVNGWDLWQLIKALRLNTLVTLPFALMTVGGLLKLLGLHRDRRLKTFLDLQLKLYSQVGADETALLYAATALSVSQQPQGLYHLQGSMQVLSDRLMTNFKDHGGQLFLGQQVEAINPKEDGTFTLAIKDQRTGGLTQHSTPAVIANVPVQNLVAMVQSDRLNPWFNFYQQRVNTLEPPSGAFVIYLGIKEAAIPQNCPPHLQFLYDYDGPIGENNSLFVSVSKPKDGRAPDGHRTIIASSFTELDQWYPPDPDRYEALKQQYTDQAIARLGNYFNLSPETIVHQEVATPLTFARYTARDRGMVGGVGQRLSTFGPFGFGTRTPIKDLWLVGDSVHPGEGTAGVSYGAWSIVQQIEANH